MAQPSFDQSLHRMFQEHPALPDTPLFAARLEQRLERDWTIRRLAIGVTGGGVGVIALLQLAGQAGLARTLTQVESSSGVISRNVDLVSVSLRTLQQSVPYSTEVMWLLGGMLVLAAGLLATRAVDQF